MEINVINYIEIRYKTFNLWQISNITTEIAIKFKGFKLNEKQDL